MLTRALAALAAAFMLLCAPSFASGLPTAQATTVIVRAHVHIHYFTAEEITAIIGSSPFAKKGVYTDLVRRHKVQGPDGFRMKHGKPVPAPKPPRPDEDYYDQLICSGFVAAADGHNLEVATARHCMESETVWFFGLFPVAKIDLTPTRVEFKNGDSGAVIGAFKSADADAAVLQVTTIGIHSEAVRLRQSTPVQGEPLLVLGMPGGVQFFLSTAISATGSTLTDPDQFGQFGGLELIECASCYGGDSGAGVFDTDGNVVGMLVAGGGQPALSAIVPASRIKELLSTFGQ